MKKFVNCLIFILGYGYIIEIIIWPFCLLNGWEKFKQDVLIKIVLYLLLTIWLYLKEKNEKKGVR